MKPEAAPTPASLASTSSARRPEGKGRAPQPNRRRAIRFVWLALLAVVLFWALKNAPLAEIWALLQQLQGWQIAALLVLNTVFLLLMGARWGVVGGGVGGGVALGGGMS